MNEIQQNEILLRHSDELNNMQLGFIDPGQMQLRMPWQKKVINHSVDSIQPLDPAAHKALFIQQALDQAFVVQGSAVRDYVYMALVDTGRVSSRHLTINSMPELLSLAHAIEVGALENLSSKFRFQIEQNSEWLEESPRIKQDNYFSCRDEFDILLIENNHE